MVSLGVPIKKDLSTLRWSDFVGETRLRNVQVLGRAGNALIAVVTSGTYDGREKTR